MEDRLKITFGLSFVSAQSDNKTTACTHDLQKEGVFVSRDVNTPFTNCY